jgi:hypothetical protein
MFDAVQAYPGAGIGVWTGAAYDPLNPEVPIAFGKVLRARAEGIVFQDDADPYNDASIVAYETSAPASVIGTDQTDTRGRYETEIPYARGNVDITTELRQGDLPYLEDNRVLVNRERDRTSFRIPPSVAEEPTAYNVSRDMRHTRGYVRDGTLRIGFSANLVPAFTEVDTGLTDVESLTMQYVRQGEINTVYVCVVSAGTGYVYTVDNEGGTVTLAITIGTADHAAARMGPDGILRTYRLDGGTVYVRAYDALLNALYTEQTTNLTGLDDAEIDADYSIETGGLIRIGLMHFVGGSAVLKFSNDGITFS